MSEPLLRSAFPAVRVETWGQSRWFEVSPGADLTFECMRGTGVQYHNAGFPGLGWTELAALGFLDDLLLQGFATEKTVLLVLGGDSDIGNGISGAATYALIAGQVAQVAAAWGAGNLEVIGCTCSPATPTEANDAQRLAYNAAILADSSGVFDDVVDLAGDPRLDDNTDMTYFDDDETHYRIAGTKAAAELIRPALLPRLAP